MSTIRDPAVITTAGRQMMTAGGDISYTKAVLYGQDISHLTKEQLGSLTSIGSPLLTVPVGIGDKNDVGANTTVVLEATFQNSNLKADLPYSAVGFFAKRGDDAEKLVVVGVANPGAYLVATPPDGVATDALDIKVAIAIGDATSVTAVVDPAGSITPATLNSAITKVTHDLTDQIATKANSTDVTAALDKKDDTADVDAKIKTVTDLANTKANTTDVNNALNGKANIGDVTVLQQTIKTLNDTLSSANATIKTLQVTITGLQTQVSNQANEIKQLQETTIKGKTFSKSQEAAAEAWEKQNSQQIAFIRDKQ